MSIQGVTLHISGIVQGVGFRPFVYSLATRLALTGWVRNTSAGVEICVDGPAALLEQFIHGLQAELPPLARIDTFEASWQPANGFDRFEIIPSAAIASAFQPISPDICICDDCLRELFDPQDRRYCYPFINCTNCGPRFTIIRDVPYDRPNTSMAGFQLCANCESEYRNPLDRRFHAQPVACPVCGPHVWLEKPGSEQPSALNNDAIQLARQYLLNGNILAIKGLGGFHLACDATNNSAVTELRRRKLRVGKPFALMFPSLESIAVTLPGFRGGSHPPGKPPAPDRDPHPAAHLNHFNRSRSAAGHPGRDAALHSSTLSAAHPSQSPAAGHDQRQSE